jgi:actin-related protein 5
MEGLLDYVFIKLGVNGTDGSIGRSVVMTEPVANLGYSRKSEFLYQEAPRIRVDAYLSNV